MPTLIHYPHFSTQEIHHHIVDWYFHLSNLSLQCTNTNSVQFHHDLIISKSDRENTIVLWSIAAFSSLDPIPSVLSAPTAHEAHTSTRSAFSPPALTDGAPPQYTRLLQFDIPGGEIVWMRFSLFPGTVDTGPVLAFCNSTSKVSFWDLRRLEEYNQIISNDELDFKDPLLRPKFLNPFQRRQRGRAFLLARRSTSPTESTGSSRSASEMNGPSTTTATANPKHVDWEKSIEGWDGRYAVDDPARDLLPHKEETVKGVSVCGRQAAWSPDGAWCVVVGSQGAWAVFQRWGNKGGENA
jgi:polycomb protein EED